MKTKTIQQRLDRLVEKNIAKKGTCAYRLIKEMCEREKDTIRPVWTSGSGRYTSNMNYTGQVCYLLDKMKVMYEVNNDAPRGGACGTFIKILNFEIDKEKIAQWKREEEERKAAREAIIKEQEERLRLYEIDSEKTYEYCKSKNFEIEFTGAKKFESLPLRSDNICKKFFHETAAKLGVRNDQGFRKYVAEKAQDN